MVRKKKDENMEEVAVEKASLAAENLISTLAAEGKLDTASKDYGALINLYTKAVWVYTGVYAIAMTIAKLPISLYVIEGDKKTKLDAHPILDLLAEPNEDDDWFSLMEALVIHLELTGEGYWEKVFKEIGGKRIAPVELYNLRPDRITPKPRKDGKGIDHYVFQTKPYAKKVIFQPDELVRFRYFSPNQDWRGQSALAVLTEELALDEAMLKWNKDFFLHGVCVEGTLETDKTLSKSDIDNVKTMVKQFLSGQGRRLLLLTKGLHYTPLGVSPKEVEFEKGREEIKDKVLAALGVPGAKVGDVEDLKFSNYELQIQSFIEDTIIPKLRKIEAVLNKQLLPDFGDLVASKTKRYRLEFDASGLIPRDEDALTKRLVMQIQHGIITPNQAREKLGLDPYDGGDTYYVSSSLVPVSVQKSLEKEDVLNLTEDEILSNMAKLNSEIAQLKASIDEIAEDKNRS